MQASSVNHCLSDCEVGLESLLESWWVYWFIFVPTGLKLKSLSIVLWHFSSVLTHNPTCPQIPCEKVFQASMVRLSSRWTGGQLHLASGQFFHTQLRVCARQKGVFTGGDFRVASWCLKALPLCWDPSQVFDGFVVVWAGPLAAGTKSDYVLSTTCEPLTLTCLCEKCYADSLGRL